MYVYTELVWFQKGLGMRLVLSACRVGSYSMQRFSPLDMYLYKYVATPTMVTILND